MLEIHLLGQFIIRWNDAVLEMAARPAQSLCAYLLMNPTPHRRERLAGLLWPDSSEANARRNLRQALWQIRRALGEVSDNYLHADDLSIAFRPEAPHWLDVRLVERPVDGQTPLADLLADVTAYVGELLPGFYDEWVTLERERLHARFEQKLHLLLERLVEAERWNDVLHWAEQWIVLGHAPEPAYRALMQAHAALGDLSAVADIYRRCQEALERELGVEPSPQTQAIYERLRHGDSHFTLSVTSTRPTALPQLHNLPVAYTSFVGRKKEIHEIIYWLLPGARPSEDGRQSGVRLLTLTGPGGTGKTRLALQVAHSLIQQCKQRTDAQLERGRAAPFADGVWLVELATVADPALLAQALGAVLGVREEPNYPLTKLLVEYLRPKSLLLLLDNCEHLVEAVAQLVDDLLRACPQVTILITSRETLGLTGETVVRVPSLSLPASAPLPPLEELAGYEAIHLFCERAATVRPEFRLTEANAAAIAQICQQLDGVPLAIELAAARVRVMTPDQIAARLDDRFRLLTGGSRTALPRQQTLRALIDWSWDLLSESERILLRRLAVFRDGWGLEAAEAICAGGGLSVGEVLELLMHLVEKSLVMAEEKSDGVRYQLLETIRQYALEKLVEAGESATIRTQHLHYFFQLAITAEPHLREKDQQWWLARLESEHDNLYLAIKWAISSGERIIMLRMPGALARFFYLRGHWQQGREMLKLVLNQNPLTEESPLELVRARLIALCGAGWLADEDGSEATLYREALTLARRVGDRWYEAFALRGLSSNEANWGQSDEVVPQLQASLAIFTELESSWGVALARYNLGWLALKRGDPEGAYGHWQDGLKRFQQMGDCWGIGVTLGALGYVARRQGDYKQARSLMEAGLTCFRELGDQAGVALSMTRLGTLAFRRGDYREAIATLQESLELERERGDLAGMATARQVQGLVACYQGDYPRAIQWLEESLGWARDWGRAIGNGLAYLAFVYYCQDELARAAAHFAESLALFRSDGDREGIAYATYGVGLVALRQGDLQLATEMLNESLALCRAWGDGRYLSAVLDALGRLAQKQGDPTLALTYFRESLLLRQRMADRQGLAESYERLASLALPSALAVRLYRIGHGLRLSIGAPLPPVERGEYESRLAELRQRLGDVAFATAWSEGNTLSPEQIRSLTLLEG